MAFFKQLPRWVYLVMTIICFYFAVDYFRLMQSEHSRGGEIYRIILWGLIAAYWGWRYFKKGKRKSSAE